MVRLLGRRKQWTLIGFRTASGVFASGWILIPQVSVRAKSVAEAKSSGGSGIVAGSVILKRSAPNMVVPTARGKAEYCQDKELVDNTVLVSDDGKLRGVFVEIIGADSRAERSHESQVSIRDCLFGPRVQGLVLQQSVTIKNDDPIAHDLRVFNDRREILQRIPLSTGQDGVYTPKTVGTIAIDCELHSWEKALVVVVDHSFFSVSDHQGTYEIDDVPPGQYRVRAWHEQYGYVTSPQVVVGDDRVQVDLVFGGSKIAACCAALQLNAKSAPLQQKGAYLAAAASCRALQDSEEDPAFLTEVRAALVGARAPAACY